MKTLREIGEHLLDLDSASPEGHTIVAGADEIERLVGALNGIADWSVDHKDSVIRAKQAVKPKHSPLPKPVS